MDDSLKCDCTQLYILFARRYYIHLYSPKTVEKTNNTKAIKSEKNKQLN